MNRETCTFINKALPKLKRINDFLTVITAILIAVNFLRNEKNCNSKKVTH